MLALIWLYCAVPFSGRVMPCDLYCACASDQISSNCCCVTTPSPTAAMAPAGTSVPHPARTSAGSSMASTTAARIAFFIDALSQA